MVGRDLGGTLWLGVEVSEDQVPLGTLGISPGSRHSPVP